MKDPKKQSFVIRTPDYRVRVFVSSTLKELAEEREAIRQAILRLRLIPVMFESGARPHPAKNLYQAYLRQSHIFIGIYWQSYGWIAPYSQISGLEDEYNLSADLPRLIYIKSPAPEREPALTGMLTRIRDENTGCYKSFATPNELRDLAENDLILLLSESFEVTHYKEQFEDTEQKQLVNVPIPRNPLIGREEELKTACDLLIRDEVALVTLTGPAGSGKSRLGIQIALELRDRFADGVYLVGLEAISDPDLVIPTIAMTLGITKTVGESSFTDSLKDFLRNKQTLLLLDNFEQILAAGPKIAELLETCPRMKALITSRAPLHLRAEKEFPVPPLALPPLKQMPELQPLSQFSSVQLFIQRAQAVKSDFMVNDENAPAVAEICHRLDGLPLAIELASAWIRMLSPQVLLARLERRFEVLHGGARDLPERQQTLYNAIEWSYNLLGEDEKRLLRWLSVFAGGWTFEAAGAICDAEGEKSTDVFDGLERLIDNNLVKPPEEVNGELRLKSLETIREFAHQHLIDSGEAGNVYFRYMQYYLNLAEQAETQLKRSLQELWHKRVEAELDNFRAAMGLAMEQNQPEIALWIASYLFVFWETHGYWREAFQWLDRGLKSMESLSQKVRAKALAHKGWLTTHLGDYARAIALLQESLALWRQIDDHVGVAQALDTLALLVMYQGNFHDGKAMLEESLSLWRQTNDQSNTYITVHHLGYAVMNLELYEQAKELYLEALREARKMGDEALVSSTLVDLGEIYTFQGDYERATQSYDEAAPFFQRLGNRAGIAYILSERAHVAIKQGDYARANNLLAESIPVLHELRRKGEAILCIERLAIVAGEQHQFERAVRLMSASESQRKEIGLAHWPIDREDRDRCISNLHNQMGETAFNEAWAQGSAMNLEQLVAYAVKIADQA